MSGLMSCLHDLSLQYDFSLQSDKSCCIFPSLSFLSPPSPPPLPPLSPSSPTVSTADVDVKISSTENTEPWTVFKALVWSEYSHICALPENFLLFNSYPFGPFNFIFSKTAGKVEYRSSRWSMQGSFSCTLDLNETAFDSSRFLAEGALIYVSAVPHWQESGERS